MRWPILLLLCLPFAALVGTFVGGITSIATSWLGQQRQTKEQRRARQKAEMQALYKLFIQDASKLYVDALEHNTTEITLAGRHLRHAQSDARIVITQGHCRGRQRAANDRRYLCQEEHDILRGQTIDQPRLPDTLRAFSEAYHEELKMY